MMRNLALPSRLARTSCSVLALATVLVVGPTPASAQSFLGSGTFTTNGGGVAGISTAPSTTTITVNGGQSVIDWTPTDNATGGGAIGFQLGGTIATFTGASNFAVLNRINQADLSRVISMDGTINSLVGGVQGGSLYFYSPGGFLLGGNSVINVGSLVLSASPLTLDGSGNFITGTQVIFGQAPRAGASITTVSGSQINANAGDAYVAMVAPRVIHGGTINVSGSAALVGAEAATINFSPDGLFDIQVTAGTTDVNGVYNDGNIIGSASAGAADIHRAYLVAVPKNAALTMLISAGSDLGFNIAGAANVVGNTVVLSAGYNVSGGSIESAPAAAGNGFRANLSVTGATVTSALVGAASGTADILAPVGQSSSFASDLTMRGVDRARVGATGSSTTINIAGNLNLSTAITGSAIGQDVSSGLVDVYALQNSLVSVAGSTTLNTSASGGSSSSSGVDGGDGTAGDINVSAQGGGTVSLQGELTATAEGRGGNMFSDGADGGIGTGGDIMIFTNGNGSAIIINGPTTLSADGTGGSGNGGECFSCDGAGGNGVGGVVHLTALVGGAIDLQSTLNASASGIGGDGTGNNAGSGLGGRVEVESTAADATISVAGAANLVASGFGGENGSGNGTGGIVIVESFGAVTSRLDFQSDVQLYAQGIGGDSFNVSGNGRGGTALIQASAGSTIEVGGNAEVNTDAFGGYSYDFTDGVGGNATGGQSRIQTFGGTGSGGTIAIDGGVTITAGGFGGSSYSSNGGTGGNGIGGSAHLITTLGNITIGTPLISSGINVSANGRGGYSIAGNGGNGTGGLFAAIEAINGDITIEGAATVSASGTGGDGRFGGDGLGSGTPPTNTVAGVGGAHIFAHNGDIIIRGGASVSSVGTGGDGGASSGYSGDYGGDGGDGTGGWASIHAGNSNLGPSSITILTGSAEGSGLASVLTDGIGGNGGDGGFGFETGYGASGAGGNGGNGGIGRGGFSVITAAAGNGLVTIDNAAGFSRGTGGNGGNGGSGISGAGGDGGNGGNGVGGTVNIGTESGANQSTAVNNGLGDYGSILANASAFGGNGGGGAGGATSGNGGNGGNAVGGASALLVRGSRVDVDTATLTANATGGDAGFGYVPTVGTPGITGIGGNATVGGDGGIGVLATSRYLIPAQRGTLNAGAISGTAIATAGIGIPNGNSTSLGGNIVTFLNANGNIGSLDFLVQANVIGTGVAQDVISLFNGDVTVGSTFDFVTAGNLSMFADRGDLTAVSMKLYANDFVPVTGPSSVAGTFFANSFDILTDNNFVTSAHLDSGQALTIVAPGVIQIGNVTGNNAITLEAQGGQIDIATVLAGGGIDLDASGFISADSITGNGIIDIDVGLSIVTGSILNTGNTSLNAGSSITVGSINSGAGGVSLVTNNSGDISGSLVAGGSIYADSDGDIFLGNLTAPGDIELVALGDILVGNALAGETIDLDAGGYIDGGNMTAGDSVYASAGQSIDLLDVSAGIIDQSTGYDADYNVGLLAGTTIDTGDIEAFRSIGLGAQGNIFTGTIDAGNIFLALGGGNMSFGTVDSGGTTYLADDSMIPLGGNLASGTFNAAPILAAAPVVSGGSITLRGPVDANRFVAAAGGALTGSTITSNTSIVTVSGGNTTLTDLDAGTTIYQRSSGVITANNLDAGSYIDIRATGGIALNNLVASDYIDLRATGAIVLGNATSGETINFLSGSTVTGLALTAGDSVLAEAMGAIQFGAITAGITDPSTSLTAQYAARFSSGGALTTGNVNAVGRIGFGTPTNLVTGNLTSGAGLMALVGGNMTAGSINASAYVYLASYSMSPLGGAFATFNRAPILALAPVATGGSITFGAVNTGRFEAAAGTTLTGTTINSGGLLHATSGGNMALGNLDADDDVRLSSSGSIDAGKIDAGTLVRVSAQGAVNVGNITITNSQSGAEPLGALFNVGPGSPVEVFGATIVTGNISTDGYVGLYTPGSMTVGTINAGHDVIALAGTNAAFGAIKTPDRFFLGGYSMFAGLNGGESFNPEAVFGATKAKTGGSATFGGLSQVNSFQAYVGTDTTLQSLTTTSSALIDTGGMFSLNGTLNGSSRIISNDIDIGTSAAVNTVNLQLVSRNATQTVVGDGVSGGGYALSDAEFDRIRTSLSVVADTSYGAAAKMLIGDLTATVSGVSQSGYDYEFATVNGNSSISVGSIKVVGDVTFTGLSLTDEVAFQTNQFELDAATGSVNLFGQGTALSGILGLYAPKIWVASGDILAKLAVNPRYAGYIAELNAPAAVQRPEGVLRAASFEIDAGAEALQSLLVQNTGTTVLPAGFLLTDVEISSDDAPDAAPGSIDLVINGQIVTASGTATGIAVRDGLVTEFGTTAFVATSTINGCPLTGSCSAAAPQRIDTLVATDVQLTDNSGLGDGLFGNEGDIDDGESGDEGDLSSPIVAPVPLFDSRPLDPSGDVDDPVSGTGNPSLFGSLDDDDEDEKKKKAKAKQGDGK